MTRFEKIAILILFTTILLTSIITSMWALKDLKAVYSDLFLTLLLGPIIGYCSGKYITNYYHKKDKAERTSTALYGLQIYIKMIALRLNDLLDKIKDPRVGNLEDSIDKLKDVLIDEPYSVFLVLNDGDLDEQSIKARTAACMIIAEIENAFLHSKKSPEHLQIVLWKRDILQTRFELLNNRHRFTRLASE